MTGAEITPLHQFSQYDQWFATIRGLRRVRFETPIQPFSGKFGGNLEASCSARRPTHSGFRIQRP